MRVKPRTRLVISLSSLVIASVLALTIFGFYIYLEWKQKNLARSYTLALYDLNGQIFKNYVLVYLEPKIATEGPLRGKPVLFGTIKNASDKKIYSMKLKIAFYAPDQRVVYVDTFYPIGTEFESLISLGGKTENFLREDDSISFERQLKNTPVELMDFLKSQQKFAKTKAGLPLELVYKIEGLEIK